MSYITKVSLKNVKPETVEKAVGWCIFCTKRDRTFAFRQEGNFIIIDSPTRDQAFKRGEALHKRYGLFFNVEKQNLPL